MARQAGINDADHVRPTLEPLGNLQGVRAMPLHAQGQRLQPAQREETVERTGHRPHRVLQEAQPLGQFRVAADHGHPADHVGMAVEIFCHRMDHQIEAHAKRTLAIGRGERVVDGRPNAVPPSHGRDGRQVGQFQQRIRRAFDPDHPRVGSDGRLERLKIGRIEIAEIQIGGAPPHPLEQTIRPAVEVVAHQHVRTVIQKFDHRGDGRQARGKRERGLPFLQIGHAALKGKSRGVLRPAILEALVNARRLLGIGARGVDRRHHRAGGRVDGLARVNHARGEVPSEQKVRSMVP